MNRSAACISANDLMHLLRREYTPDEQAAVREHAETCRACRRLLQDLEVGRTILGTAPVSSENGESKPEETDHGRALNETLTTSTASTDGHKTQLPDGQARLGGYRIIGPLGSGGMGSVFLAEDVALQRPVALKTMHEALRTDAKARDRFLREARAAAGLRSDHIVTIYQVGEENGVPFLAMELLNGESLESRLQRGGQLSWPELLRIGLEIAEGLAVAHTAGVIHRDVKPANIWLEAPLQRVKLLDFGLARHAHGGAQLTGSGQMVGTPQYMAPEQALGEAIDERADLFSLGCVLYRMATGSPAFPGESVLAVLTALATQEPRPLETIRPDAPPAFVQLVNQLLSKKAADRPGSAGEVAATLAGIEHAPSRFARATFHSKRVWPRGARWHWAVAGAILVAAVTALLGFLPRNAPRPAAAGPPIRVGVLFSTTGTLAESGSALVDATTLAIEEINAQGGIHGRPLEPVFRDGQSDPATYAVEAEHLISDEHVCVIFGCWSSASRKAVKGVVERKDHLLIYPLQFEGLEQSPNIIYTGAAPNQQLRPAVKHFYAYLNKRKFFLVGSDYVFPRAANAILRDELKQLGAALAGEKYVPLGASDFRDVIAAIVQTQPDVILNTINGDSNHAFFRGLREAGITPERIPTISFSISEHELRGLNPRDMAGDYAAWNYFQSVDRPENRKFVERFQTRFGKLRVTSDPIECAYFGVHLWAEAARAADSSEPAVVRKAMLGRSINAPEGEVRIDPVTQHTFKHFRLGRILPTGQFEIVTSTENLIAPEPFPPTRTRAQWEAFLNDLYRGWGDRWQRP